MLPRSAAEHLPNVELRPLPQEEFSLSFRRAAAVVVCLEPRNDRSAGQQTYLRSMALGIPTVVTDALGANEYIDDGRTGWLVPPKDPDALRDRLEWILDPENAEKVTTVTACAVADVTRFSPDATVDALLAWITHLAQ